MINVSFLSKRIVVVREIHRTIEKLLSKNVMPQRFEEKTGDSSFLVMRAFGFFRKKLRKRVVLLKVHALEYSIARLIK